MPFADRTDAGRRLAQRLAHLRNEDVVVLGLPRGGVPVASEVAAALEAPLDVLVVRKLGVPFQRELAMGAIGEGGVRVLNEDVLRAVGVTESQLEAAETEERAEAERRSWAFRGGRPPTALAGRTAVVIDDGIATGATARAACQIARAQGAGRIVLAVPVAPPDADKLFEDVADEVVAVERPAMLSSIGQWYTDFTQTPDQQVVALLQEAADRYVIDEDVEVEASGLTLPGRFTAPPQPAGVVVFAHGSGSGRHSPRNQRVAAAMHEADLATLLFDLLTPHEAADRANVFDIELLASRVVAGVRWIADHSAVRDRPIGLFGASTGAAAALWAATEPGVSVRAIVSRGGRPDLAASRLESVTAPTLLLVGGRDPEVLELNLVAQQQLPHAEVEVVDGAGHLFEEPGALEQVATLSGRWFGRHLGKPE